MYSLLAPPAFKKRISDCRADKFLIKRQIILHEKNFPFCLKIYLTRAFCHVIVTFADKVSAEPENSFT